MNLITDEFSSRREFLTKTAIILTGATAICSSVHVAQAQEKTKMHQIEEVSPPEDLMREHGVLRRVLLIYDCIEGCLNCGKEFPLEVLSNAANIIRKFVEEYHEKLEEQHIFPRFEKAGKLTELVKILKEQHKRGRHLTKFIKTSAATAATLKATGKRKELAEKIHLFTRMYRPHAAREDTILFPAFRSIVSVQEFGWLGEAFEAQEDALFGKGGFEKVVAQVADLEKPLGIYELQQFTPPK